MITGTAQIHREGTWGPPLVGGEAHTYREGREELFEAIFGYWMSKPDFYSRKNVLAALWRWIEEGKTKDMKVNYEVTVTASTILVELVIQRLSSVTVERPE